MQNLASLQVKRSLVIIKKLLNTSFLMGCQKPYDLGYQEIRKYQENFKTLHTYCLELSPPPEAEILLILAKKS